MASKQARMKKAYTLAKASKVGDTCTCPSCGTQFVKTNYQQAFCRAKGGTVCKDKYWNTVTPTKRNNTTRISPASAAFLARRDRWAGEEEHPHSSEGLGQWL